MNWENGFKRISAAWWGLLAIMLIGYGLTILFLEGSGGWNVAIVSFLCLIPIYLFYRATNWIIEGFFVKTT